MRELVDHAELRLAREDRVDVHLLEGDPAIVDLPPRDDLQVAQLRLGLRASVRLDKPNDNVDAIALEVRARPRSSSRSCRRRRGADVNAETGALLRLDLGEHLFAGRTASRFHGTILDRQARRSRGSLRTLYVFRRLAGLRHLYEVLTAFLRAAPVG